MMGDWTQAREARAIRDYRISQRRKFWRFVRRLLGVFS